VDGSDNQFVTGGINDGMTESAYIKKYLPSGTLDPAFPAVTLQVFINGIGYATEGHGIAVDPVTGTVDIVGTAMDPATGNRTAFLAQYDSTGMLLNLAAYGNDPNPNSFDSIAVNAQGEIAFTGALFVSAAGHSALAVGALSASGSLLVLTFDLSMTSGGARMGIAINNDTLTAYIAGCVASNPGGPQEGLLGWIDRHNPTNLNYRLFPSPAGDVVAHSVAVNTSGVHFAIMTLGVAAVAELDPTLNTFLNEYDFTDPTLTVSAIALDAIGNVYVTGQSMNIASGNLMFQLTWLDGSLNLLNTIQIGGSGTDAGLALAVKSNGSVAIVGTTNSTDLAVTDGSALNGTTDGFLLSYTFQN
jgi:hypothetical protein